ncbi:hypothetical protein [Caulobacter sp.]|uniref:hypothetical protein n=1 Tax=Caulobacter sp. TaxID=78 RepID=UPI001B0EA93E|nr:hypothetical protein [Caulobacter sp.]MBO9544619.1 hypothetical protein [Caulobacter sp.]
MARARASRGTSNAAPRKPAPKRAPVNDIPPLEWVAAGVGLVLASTAIGLTAWDAMFGVKGPPAIEVRLKRVTPTAHGYVAEIEAINHGGAPAAQVQIEGQTSKEAASVTIDYIPEQSTASGGLIFEDDPRLAALKLRATGFADAS